MCKPLLLSQCFKSKILPEVLVFCSHTNWYARFLEDLQNCLCFMVFCSFKFLKMLFSFWLYLFSVLFIIPSFWPILFVLKWVFPQLPSIKVLIIVLVLLLNNCDFSKLKFSAMADKFRGSAKGSSNCFLPNQPFLPWFCSKYSSLLSNW